MNSRIIFKTLGALVFIISAILGAVAWSITSRYNLPISSILPILTTFTPLANLFPIYRSIAARLSPSARNKGRPLPPLQLLGNLLMLILPTVLLSLAAPRLGDSTCRLQETWQGWYSARDSAAIKGVQDALQCCGFRTVTHEPFPFPKNPSKGADDGIPSNTCAKSLGLDKARACFPVWQEEMKLASGLIVGAGVILVLVNLFFLIFILGEREVVERWFSRSRSPGYSQIVPTIEEEEDEYEEPSREGRGRITGEERVEREQPTETSRLLLPKTHGSSEATEQPWSTEGLGHYNGGNSGDPSDNLK